MSTKVTLGALASAFFLAASPLAQASTLYSTGIDANNDGIDDHYSVVGFIPQQQFNANAGYLPNVLPAYNSQAGAAYLYSNGAYAGGLNFISNASGGGDGLQTFVYTVTFNLDAPGLISGMWAADNGGAIYNGSNQVAFLGTIANGPDTNYNTAHFFQFAGNAGDNILTLYITDGGAPSAFAFAPNADNAAPVPGPIVGAGLPGLVMALSSLVFLSRRRRKAGLA